ncbi:MAG: hypothetical protein GY770_25010 [Aestuariibacter sp.]|nr:hypothetical protein [Aestuariibacter sp.]
MILFAFLLMGDESLLPISTLMVLWINLVSDGIPALVHLLTSRFRFMRKPDSPRYPTRIIG